PEALRPYLAEFLWDPRVIEPPPARAIWWLILHGIILRRRPARSARLYRNIWTDEGSPLVLITRRQTAALADALRRRVGRDVPVETAMRYGQPSIESALDRLLARGCRRVLIFPLYPQYSATTTGSTYDAFFAALMKLRAV